MTLRFDIATLEKPTLDHNGYLKAEAVLTRTGVFVYNKPGGAKARELRHPDDVFNKDSLNTLLYRPFVDRHPVVGRVDSENTSQLQRGMVISEARIDGDYVKADVIVTDQKVIDKIMREKNPVREISCGYNLDVVEQSGEYKGEKYDAIQKNIVYNHVALVPKGRAGPGARLRLDADDGAVDGIDIELNKPSHPKSTEEPTMAIKIKRDAVTTGTYKQDAFTVTVNDEEAENAIKPALNNLDSALGHIRKLEAENAQLRGRNDELTEKAELPPERLDELGQQRADLLGVAFHVGLSNIETLRNDEIKKMIVKKVNKRLNVDELEQSYIDGRYDSIVEQIKSDNKAVRSLAELKKITQRDDYLDGERDTRTPRQKLADDTADMWEKPESKQTH